MSDPDKSIQFRDIAVLFRSVRGSAEPFQRMFSLFGIPYSLGPIVGLDYGIRSDIRAALHLIIDGPTWENAARLALGRGGSANARQRLERRFNPEELDEIVCDPNLQPPDLDPGEAAFLETLRPLVADALAVPLGGAPSMVLYRAMHISGHLNEQLDPAQAQQLAQLVRAASALDGPDATPDDLLDLVAGNMRDYDDQPPDDKFGVQLLTVHAAKGLEWPVVFVAGMAETVFPLVARNDRDADVLSLVRALSSDAERASSAAEVEQLHVQEERRLAYVAVTRASRELHLTYARSYGDERVEPSRFLAELGFEPTTMPVDDEYERLASVHALGRQLRYRQKMALKTDPAGEAGSAALVDLLVAQWAARHVPGVVPLRDRRLPVPYAEGESISFSASDLSTYDSCPRQYLYAALLRLQREESGAALLLGNLVHKVLELVNRTWQETGVILDDAAVESLIDEHWPRVGFDVGVQSRQLRLRARAMIRRYLSWERSLPAGRKPVWIEQYNKVPYETHTLRGKVDVVMQNPDGSVEILDYKTGRHEPYTKSRQLFLYAHMWIAMGGSMAPGKLSTAFIALKHDEDKGFRVGLEWKPKQLRATPVSDDWLAERSEDVDQLVAGIVGNQFPSNPGDACTWCRCRWMCPDG